MELPDNLKNLYRHWKYHVIVENNTTIESNTLFKDEDLFHEISWFIEERISIWNKRTTNSPQPYTKDKIMSTYRFCNIFREFDRQTIEIHTLLNPLRDDFELWLLNMFYCRLVAMPETIRKVGLLSYDDKNNILIYKKLKECPSPKYGVPYVFPISTIMRSNTPTRELFLTQYLPTVMKTVATRIKTWKKKSVYGGVEEILKIFGYNHSFLWTEVLIDVGYQYPQYIDLFARFPIGPGSAPTMKRIDVTKDPSILVTELSKLNVNASITYNNKLLQLSAENWEGIGCEFRKYTNLKQGEGRKRIYVKK